MIIAVEWDVKQPFKQTKTNYTLIGIITPTKIGPFSKIFFIIQNPNLRYAFRKILY